MTKISLGFLAVLISGNAAAQSFNFVPQAGGVNYIQLNDPGITGFNSTDIVFIGDGFLETEMNAFDKAAKNCIGQASPQVGQGLLTFAPYDTHKCRFRFWEVQLISKESGIDEPRNSIYKDTALDCSFGGASDPFMKVKGDAAKVQAAVTASGVPTWDYIVVITNSADVPGAYFPTSGNIIYLSSYNAWGVYLAHELGHAIVGLGDEYECRICTPSEPERTYTGGARPEPNLTSTTAVIKWGSQIQSWVKSFIPTLPEFMLNCDVVGAWEGGGTYKHNIYRPEEYCIMDGFTCSSGEEFCAVCENALDGALRFCGVLAWYMPPYLREWPNVIYKLPPCLVCPPRSAAADDLRHAIEFDSIVLKLLHRGPIHWIGDPESHFAVYDDWSEKVDIRTEVVRDGVEISFEASRIRTYTAVFDVLDDLETDQPIRIELYRNGRHEPLP